MTASKMIGIPHKIIAIHAASKGRGIKSKILIINAIPEMIRKAISFFMPPHSRNASNFFTVQDSFLYPVGYLLCMILVYLWGYRYVKRRKKKTAL